MSNNPTLSIFTPSRSNTEDLEAIFVQREDLLQDAIECVIESATTDNKHHLQFVGQRGTGKTHLMTLLVHRLSQEKNLNSKLRIAWLNEDETSTNLLEFLVRIFLTLGKRYPKEFTEEAIDPIYDLGMEEAERLLISLLLKKLKDRCLLVVVENLDALFEGLGKEGQRKLRAFIQENPVLSIVATAQRLVDDISKRDSAFFGFFQTEQLKTLSVNQAAELLSNIATLNNQADLAEFIQTPIGHARIRALHHLSGGNHRIYIVLSQFITSKTIDSLIEPFSKMIDEMTPYYQERIRWLPPQQRKIVEFLCNCERPTTVKDISRKLFSSNQTISSQLKDLRNKGYVQSAKRGRDSLYEISEPLLRICVEIKENQTNKPIGILVDFLRVWYDERELSSLLKECNKQNTALPYLRSAITKNTDNGNLRTQLIVNNFANEINHYDSTTQNLIQSYADMDENLGLAVGLWQQEKIEHSLSVLFDITNKKEHYKKTTKITALFLSSAINFEHNKLDQSLEDINNALEQKEIPKNILTQILLLKSKILKDLNRNKQIISTLNELLDITNDDEKIIIKALMNRAKAYNELENYSLAIIDLNRVIKHPLIDLDSLAHALNIRGSILISNGDLIDAEEDFKTCLKLKKINIKNKLHSHAFLSIINLERDNQSKVYNSLNFLLKNQTKQIGHSEDITLFIVDNIFSSKSDQKKKLKKLIITYSKYEKMTALSDIMVNYLGELRDKKDTNSSESLESWYSLWDEALTGINEMKLSLRIFRTGINFLKSEREDQTILLELHKEERDILQQALKLK